MIVGPLKDARSFFWFTEIPPGDVCPRDKALEEPSGRMSEGGIHVTEGRAKLESERLAEWSL